MFPRLVVYLTFLLPFRNHPNVIYDKLFEGRKFESFLIHWPLHSPPHAILTYIILCWIILPIADRNTNAHTYTHMCTAIYIHATYVYMVQESVGYQYWTPIQGLNMSESKQRDDI